MNKVLLIIILIKAILLGLCCECFMSAELKNQNTYKPEIKEEVQKQENIQEEVSIDDWKLVLVNYENYLPEDFEVELANIDSTRKFDKRAINDLFAMKKALKDSGITNIWVQSAYRSIEYQTGLFDKKVNYYVSLRKNGIRCRKINFKNNK